MRSRDDLDALSGLDAIHHRGEAPGVDPVEEGGRLIEEQNLRLQHQNGRQRDELLLARGDLMGAALGKLGDAQLLQARHRLLAAPRP